MPGMVVTNGSANSRKATPASAVNGNGSASASKITGSKAAPKPSPSEAPRPPSSSTTATLAAPEVQPLLQAIFTAPSATECSQAASELCEHVNSHGLRALHEQSIITAILAAASNKKSGYEREAAAVVVEALAYKCGGKNATPFALGADPWLLDAFLLPLLELYADKGDVVREAAEKAATALLSLAPQESAPDVLQRLYKVLQDGSVKWQTKIGALKLISRLSESASEQIGELLEDLIPILTSAMHETKAEVSKQAIKTTTKVCQNTLQNNDLRPFIPDLVGCMARPDSVPECIKKLSSTTFVAEVTGPALAVMVPLLFRALNERNQTVQRSTVIVVENLCKLVHDPKEASKFLPALTPGVQRIHEGASFPEVREHAKSALDTLQNATKELAASQQQGTEAGAGAEKDTKLEGEQAQNAALDAVIAVVKNASEGKEITQIKNDEWAMIGLQHVSKLLVRLADKRILQQSPWDDVYVLPYLRRVLNSQEKGKQATDELRKMYLEIDATRFGKDEDDEVDEQEGECLVNIQFSLAYGGLLLLNNTRLKLHRGHRYGIVAANGSGKSTLLKAMRDGKVDGFPTQDVLRTIMVEHSLQGEDGSQAILPFVCKTPGLEKKTKEEVAAALQEVGFDEERQQNPVGSLSGGWKMKLELARAMLNGADILLLDEPTNHLDVQSVAWLEKYLVSHKEITVLTVSHDSGFLDNVCTDIMHYENKKIRYFKGNLKRFVELKPEAKSHYSLSASVVKFSFPEPGHLMGVRSNTRTILKLTDATYTYPGMSKPSLRNASAAISLSSRVGVLGPNGAGKSTLIKCLTGEVVPQEGKVEKHPALRVALMAQHAFHHIEQHLEKTACQYIMWRYQGGQDKEISEKASRKMTDEEEKQLQVPIVSKTGEQRRIEYIVGRAKHKKSFQYEVKFQGLQHKFNAWIPRERLLELGFFKMVQSFDDFENSREGSGNLELNSKVIRKHLEAMSLNGDIAEHHEMSGLSGGQKVKVCLCAALISNPQVLVLDEPTNYLDRDSLGGLAVAIKEWGGAVIIISHNMEFVEALCPEIWNVDNGQIISKTRRDLDSSKFEDAGDGASTPGLDSGAATPNGVMSPPQSRTTSRLTSKAGTPISSAAGTPAGSGDEKEEDDMSKLKAGKGKKKKMTKNEKKAQEVRRRQRVLDFLSTGVREPDTDEE